MVRPFVSSTTFLASVKKPEQLPYECTDHDVTQSESTFCSDKCSASTPTPAVLTLSECLKVNVLKHLNSSLSSITRKDDNDKDGLLGGEERDGIDPYLAEMKPPLSIGIFENMDSQKKLATQRQQNGQCKSCGQQLYNVKKKSNRTSVLSFSPRKKGNKKTPLTIEDKVYKGRCLACFPFEMDELDEICEDEVPHTLNFRLDYLRYGRNVSEGDISGITFIDLDHSEHRSSNEEKKQELEDRHSASNDHPGHTFEDEDDHHPVSADEIQRLMSQSTTARNRFSQQRQTPMSWMLPPVETITEDETEEDNTEANTTNVSKVVPEEEDEDGPVPQDQSMNFDSLRVCNLSMSSSRYFESSTATLKSQQQPIEIYLDGSFASLDGCDVQHPKPKVVKCSTVRSTAPCSPTDRRVEEVVASDEVSFISTGTVDTLKLEKRKQEQKQDECDTSPSTKKRSGRRSKKNASKAKGLHVSWASTDHSCNNSDIIPELEKKSRKNDVESATANKSPSRSKLPSSPSLNHKKSKSYSVPYFAEPSTPETPKTPKIRNTQAVGKKISRRQLSTHLSNDSSHTPLSLSLASLTSNSSSSSLYLASPGGFNGQTSPLKCKNIEVLRMQRSHRSCRIPSSPRKQTKFFPEEDAVRKTRHDDGIEMCLR